MARIVKGVPFFITFFIFWTSWYQVNETERAVVLQFGSKPLWEVTDAGLHLKAPWPYHSVRFLEKRLMQYDDNPREIITKDKKTMVVDTFALFKIASGIQYLRRIQTQSNAMARMGDIIYSEMGNDMGTRDFVEILVSQRNDIMADVTGRTQKQLPEYGLTTAIVRMSRTDLPTENKQSVHNRMKAERERQAKQYRSLGEERAQTIRSETDKDVTIITSAAEKEAQKTMGEGDAEATRIYNLAYSRNPTFFELYRGLIAAQRTLGGGGDIRVFLRGDEPHLRALFGR